MSDNYIINSDGTITRTTSSSSYSGGSYNGGSSGGSGYGWVFFLIICVVVGIIIAVVFSNKRHQQEYETPVSQVVSLDDDEYVEVEQNDATTYLTISPNSVTFDAEGGSVDIEVSTDGNWSIGTPTASWGHLSEYGSHVTLTVDPNTENESRTDWFTIEAGNYERRIEITQGANTTPSAKIERVWVDHNLFNNGVKGMMIHLECEVYNLKGQTVYFYAYFYQGDNSTPLHDYYGNNLSFSAMGNVLHTSGKWDDFRIFVPYTGLNMAPGVSGEFSFDISVKHNGNELDRNNNNRFTFTSGY